MNCATALFATFLRCALQFSSINYFLVARGSISVAIAFSLAASARGPRIGIRIAPSASLSSSAGPTESRFRRQQEGSQDKRRGRETHVAGTSKEQQSHALHVRSCVSTCNRLTDRNVHCAPMGMLSVLLLSVLVGSCYLTLDFTDRVKQLGRREDTQ